MIKKGDLVKIKKSEGNTGHHRCQFKEPNSGECIDCPMFLGKTYKVINAAEHSSIQLSGEAINCTKLSIVRFLPTKAYKWIPLKEMK